MDVASLPYVDEHSVIVAAPPAAVWDAAMARFESSPPRLATGLLGCDPPQGFRVEESSHRPDLLVLSGRHHFSRYAIVLRCEPSDGGTLCRLESRAEFPGPHGRAYRLAVISSGLHVLAVRGLLRGIAAAALR